MPPARSRDGRRVNIRPLSPKITTTLLSRRETCVFCAAGSSIGLTINGSSFAGSFTRVDIGHVRKPRLSRAVRAPGDCAFRKHVDLWARLALHAVNCAAEHAASREDIMSVQPLRKEGDRNPRTAEEAKANESFPGSIEGYDVQAIGKGRSTAETKT
jgi:hypothetical protein